MGLEQVFQRSTQADVEIASEGALKQHTALEVHIRQKKVERLPYAEKNPLQLPMDSREG